MLIQLSYPFTGEDKAALQSLLMCTTQALTASGIQVQCLALDFGSDQPERATPRAAMLAAFAQIDRVDGLLVLQTSPRRSEGMLMEVGYALAQNKPVVVAAHESARPSYLPDMAVHAFVWRNESDLAQQLARVTWPVAAS